MRLWTVQPVEVWNLLQITGFYVCDASKSECLEEYSFGKAYDWLVSEMEKRIGSRPEGIEYPVWAWHTHDGKNSAPDLDEYDYVSNGSEAVCLEIEIPDEQVVLTDFINWHCVLNDSYCDEAITEEEWDKEMEWFDSLYGEERKKVKIDSWQRIFDTTRIHNDFITSIYTRYI